MQTTVVSVDKVWRVLSLKVPGRLKNSCLLVKQKVLTIILIELLSNDIEFFAITEGVKKS